MKSLASEKTVTLKPKCFGGTVAAPPSKSAVHRLLICAAASEEQTRIRCAAVSEDIEATMRCLRALGADIEVCGEYITVKSGLRLGGAAVCDCGESGSTLRFMLPLAAALGTEAEFVGKGRLSKRPIKPLCDAMGGSGVWFSGECLPLKIKGSMKNGSFPVRADVSSQFITGLLLALPLCGGESEIFLEGRAVSAPYIDITTDIQKKFGVDITKTETGYKIQGQKYVSPREISAEGDYSNAAFWLVSGTAAEKPVRCTGLDSETKQGDREIITALRSMGADIKESGAEVTVIPGRLHAAEIDGENIPDLIPVLSVAACRATGKTVIKNTARLRQKESDRVESTVRLIRALGGKISAGENYMEIEGCGILRGGTAEAFGDHRIAMSAAAASVFCENEVTVIGADAVNKSYPTFFEEFDKLGGGVVK